MADTMVVSMASLSPSTASLRTPCPEHCIPSSATSVICRNWTGLRQLGGPARHTAGQRQAQAVRRDGQINCTLKDAEQLVRDGKIRCTGAAEVQDLIKNEGYRVLDVRPPWEHEKASAPGFVHVPMFVEDDRTSALMLMRKGIAMGSTGLWTGQSRLTRRNENFAADVQNTVPDKATPLIVCCQEGLRSLLAIEELYNAGYINVAWLSGGFNVSKEEDFPGVVGSMPLQFSSLGGVSSVLMKVNSIAQDAVGNVWNAMTQK